MAYTITSDAKPEGKLKTDGVINPIKKNMIIKQFMYETAAQHLY